MEVDSHDSTTSDVVPVRSTSYCSLRSLERKNYLSISLFFCFPSRRRHTSFDCDWSSDVCSSDLAGTAAFHINADIASAVVRYVAATEDQEFEREVGLEILVETARLWRWRGHHDRHGRFRIDGVTGPDEYSAIADNNTFTNLMAQRNLLAAADAVERHPRTAARLGVDAEEAATWRDAAAAVVVPYDESVRVHQQAESFTQHQVWDFANTRPGPEPLVLH